MHIDKDTFSPMFTEETIRVRQQCFNHTLNALAEPAEEVHFADVVCNNGLFSLYKIDPNTCMHLLNQIQLPVLSFHTGTISELRPNNTMNDDNKHVTYVQLKCPGSFPRAE
jgi:hypothetical protein